MKEKTVLGLHEHITVHGEEEERRVVARIDSGAEVSSIDTSLAADLKLGPIEAVKTMRSANGKKVRPALHATVKLLGKEFTELFTIADRSNMTYPVLIGQNILKHGFLIDPSQRDPTEEK